MDIYLKYIPEYLKKSQLYRDFLENSEENHIITINPIHNVKYAHENGCPWDTEICSHISLNCNLDSNYLECLNYVLENK